ncbi:MAG: tRNA 5-methoxyuridine(34)/uridine 5-oxyacetic acid(34) synthase CmoB [Pseudomonadota bacterium]|nr:tRNA 5-methoxyuridine(34)/uridine 5-oxyacetic acid(34) synthase CmoB [Pseudomonadota bacterium]
MPDYQPLLHWLDSNPPFARWAPELAAHIARGLSPERWGDLADWQAVLRALPALQPSSVDFAGAVRIGEPGDCDGAARDSLATTLMGLHPWRKGPFELFGITIDTEWRSDWKWDRLKPHLPDLAGQRILDVGCGNGYHCLRLFGAGAERVIGIDPSPRFVHQFYALKHYCPGIPVDVLPLGIEHMPADLHAFDTVLSMGVIYHRRDPLAHIRELMGCLRPGGLLVLETLIVPEDQGPALIPEGRYAKMRNVWCVPSPDTVLGWLGDSGLEGARLVDCGLTTTEEQRRTPWMTFESLADFLDPADSSRTLEGHPAPRRGIFLARVPAT